MRLRADQLSWRELDGQAVVLDLAASKYLTVNETGTVLLRRLAEGDCDRVELVRALMQHYGICEEQACADVEAFIGNLERKGLLDQ